MSGFAATLQGWDESITRRQAGIDARWEALQKKGFKSLSGEALKWIKRVIWGTVLTVLVIYAVIQAVEDNALSVLMVLPVIGLLAVKRWWPSAALCAAGLVACYGIIGILVFVTTCLGGDGHVAALYGVTLLVSVIGTAFIDQKATGLLVLFATLALLTSVIVGLLGGVLSLGSGDFPTDLVKHLIWLVLGLATVFAAFTYTRLPAAILVLTALSAAGFHRFVWAYDGLRRQDVDVWGWFIAIPDQAFYGFLLLLAAVAIILARPVSQKLVVTEEDLPPAEDEGEPADEDEVLEGDWDGDLEGEVVPDGDIPRETLREMAFELAQATVLERFYDLDTKTRIFTHDGSRFLAKVLPKVAFTQKQIDEVGLTPAIYSEYAAQRAIDEIRKAHAEASGVIIRKDGTVHPDKLAKLGFRKDFLEDHAIQPTELLTGELIEIDPGEND